MEEDEETKLQEQATTTKEKLRIGNLDWCTCSNCKFESREIDCLCCKEVNAISDEQFSGEFLLCKAM